jgi:hypothetical protein
MHNKITGPSSGGPRLLPVRASLTARVGEFCRSAASIRYVRIR